MLQIFEPIKMKVHNIPIDRKLKIGSNEFEKLVSSLAPKKIVIQEKFVQRMSGKFGKKEKEKGKKRKKEKKDQKGRKEKGKKGLCDFVLLFFLRNWSNEFEKLVSKLSPKKIVIHEKFVQRMKLWKAERKRKREKKRTIKNRK